MTIENPYIKYDNRLKDRARELRKNQTKAEKYIWDKILKNKQFFWYKFTRQKMLEFFIADFYCSELKLIIEIDWDTHFTDQWKAYDIERSQILEWLWLRVIRFTNKEVFEDINWVFEILKKEIPSSNFIFSGNEYLKNPSQSPLIREK